jgi:hypothetical protein
MTLTPLCILVTPVMGHVQVTFPEPRAFVMSADVGAFVGVPPVPSGLLW